jgi:hypothetical protein
LRRGSEGAAVAAIEEVVGEELDRPVRWGRCRVLGWRSLARQAATRRGSALSPRPDQMRSSKGRERKGIRAKDARARMRLRMRIRLRGVRSPGHAANRHCPLVHPRQGMPLTGIVPLGQRPLRSCSPGPVQPPRSSNYEPRDFTYRPGCDTRPLRRDVSFATSVDYVVLTRCVQHPHIIR